jgi:hypothetical protein
VCSIDVAALMARVESFVKVDVQQVMRFAGAIQLS